MLWAFSAGMPGPESATRRCTWPSNHVETVMSRGFSRGFSATACAALLMRFSTTCCRPWPSPRPSGSAPLSSRSTMTSFSFRSYAMSASVRRMTSLRSRGTCSEPPEPLRANVRRLRTIRPARSACSWMTCRWPRSFLPSSFCSSRNSDRPAIEVSGLLSSCATPETSWPTAASFSLCTSCVSRTCCSVPSSTITTTLCSLVASRILAALRRRQGLGQRARLPHQGLVERGADDVLQRHVQQAGQRAVGAPHPPFLVHDRDAFAERVERRFPLLLRAPHHLEEARVRDHHGGVRRERGEQPDVLRREYALAGVGDDQRADHGAVRAERHGGRGGGVEALHDRRRLRAGVADQFEVLAPGGARDQPRVIA